MLWKGEWEEAVGLAGQVEGQEGETAEWERDNPMHYVEEKAAFV